MSIAFVFLIWVMLNTNLGGRLVGIYEKNSAFFQDQSSQNRLETIFEFRELIDEGMLWEGFGDYSWENMRDRGYTIENGYIAFLLKFGIIFGSIYLSSLILLHFKLLKQYPRFDRAILLFAFYGFAFTNPHLADGTIWLQFAFAYYGFLPKSSLTESSSSSLADTYVEFENEMRPQESPY